MFLDFRSFLGVFFGSLRQFFSEFFFSKLFSENIDMVMGGPFYKNFQSDGPF